MKYLCTKCNYIYDEMIWEVEDWIECGTRFDNLWDNFFCPQCNESWEYFQEITPYVHSLDEELMVWIEAEHMPIIEKLDNWFIKIEVNHPDEESHFVWNIWIYDEYWDLVHEEFIQPWNPAYLEFDTSDLDEYEIRVQCSVHWIFGKKFEN